MKYYTKHTLLGWLFMAGIASLLFHGLLKPILLLIGFEFPKLVVIMSFVTMWIILFAFIYYTQRTIRYVELTGDHITIEYYSNSKMPKQTVSLAEIVGIDVCLPSEDKREMFYTVNTSKNEKIYFDPYNVPYEDLNEYCEKKGIVIKEKNV